MNYIQFDEINNKKVEFPYLDMGKLIKLIKHGHIGKPSLSNAKPHVHVYRKGTQVVQKM